MATAQELDELVGQVRRILPDQRHLTRLAANEQSGVVEIIWHSRQFAVTTALEVFEVKGRTLILSGASRLIQSSLRTKEKHKKVLGAVIEAIRIAEDSMRFDPDRGLILLEEAKKALLKLARKEVLTKPKEMQTALAQ
ncbi:MAG: hypothetical protein HY735_10045 [Verrucomicrobia bacterium]|nr:hypothetical protein [Verrucomicrobiota bacterium]